MLPLPRARWTWTVLAAIAGLALVVFAIRSVPDTAPESDFAVIDLRVLNVIRHFDAAGPYSRYSWNHPGPLYFQLLAPLYFFTGYRHLSIVVMATAINVLSIAGILLVVRRCTRGHGLWIAGAALFGLYLTRTWGLLASPWTAHIPILPLALLAACAAATVSGRSWFLPAVAVVASFIVQTHVGLSLCAGALSLAALASVVIRLRQQRPTPGTPLFKTPLIASAAVVIVLWALPIADSILPTGQGNLIQLFNFFAKSEPAAVQQAGRVFEHYIASPFGVDLTLPWGATLPRLEERHVRSLTQWQYALLAISGLYWWWRRRAFELSWVAMSMVASAAAFLALRRLPELPQDHTVYWVSVIGVMNWTAAFAMPLDWIARASIRGTYLFGTSGVPNRYVPLAIVAVAVAGGVQAKERRAEEVAKSPRIEAISQLALQHLQSVGDRAPLVGISNAMWAIDSGLVLQLSRAGLRPVVSADWTDMFGRRMMPSGHERVILQVVDPGAHTFDLRFRADYQLLGNVEDIYVYAVDPPPASTPATDVRLVSESNLVKDRVGLLVDHQWTPNVGDFASPGIVPFTTVESFVTIAVPDDAVGVRLWGQAGSVWQLLCSTADGGWRRLGQARISGEAGTGVGETFPRDITGCQKLKVSAAMNAPNWWLSEVQMLVRR